MRARGAIEQQLASDGVSATLVVSHWDPELGELGDWHQVDPPLDANEPRPRGPGARGAHPRGGARGAGGDAHGGDHLRQDGAQLVRDHGGR